MDLLSGSPPSAASHRLQLSAVCYRAAGNAGYCDPEWPAEQTAHGLGVMKCSRPEPRGSETLCNRTVTGNRDVGKHC